MSGDAFWSLQQGRSSIGRVSVSKTEGWGFEALRPCQQLVTIAMADKLKFALALILLGSGVAGYYFLGEQPMILRVLSVLAGMAAGVAVAWFTLPGRQFFECGKEAWAETRKVAWPTRKETVQTTGIVFAFVLVMAIMLWITDKGLEWVLYDLVLGWKKS